MCPATGLVQIIGRKYALRLLTVIGERQRMRFNELKFAMDDIISSTLTIRLAIWMLKDTNIVAVDILKIA